MFVAALDGRIVCLEMKRDSPCPLPSLATISKQTRYSLPCGLPDLVDSAKTPLPALFDNTIAETETPWIPGLTCPSVHRGGAGDGAVGLQAYHLVNNLFENIQKLGPGWEQLASEISVAGISLSEWGIVGLVGDSWCYPQYLVVIRSGGVGGAVRMVAMVEAMAMVAAVAAAVVMAAALAARVVVAEVFLRRCSEVEKLN